VRRLILLAGLFLTLAACSDVMGGAATTVAETSAPTTADTTLVEDTSSIVPATTTQSPDTTDSGRPVAPDFTLELGEGGVYTLSEGARPVYLVFWAEW